MRLLIILASLIFAPFAFAQELQEGVVYTGGDRVAVGEEGVAMTIPTGWQGAVSGDVFLMTKPGVQGVLVVLSDKATAQELEMFMSSAQELPGGYIIQPTTRLQRRGDILTVSINLIEGNQQFPAEFSAKSSRFGRAVGVISVIVEPSARSETIEAGKQALASVQLTKPDIPSPGEATGPWASTVRNQTLTAASSRGSESSKSSYTFCGNGQFSYYGSISSYSNTDYGDAGGVSGYGLSRGGDQGTWALKDNRIYLWFEDGSEERLEISTNSQSNLFLNGIRYFRAGDACQ